MDSINKEHIVAGVIGGVTALFLGYGLRKIMWRRRWAKKCSDPNWKRPQAELLTMVSERMPKAVGPFCFGKVIKMRDGSRLAWSSGQLGLDPVTGKFKEG